MRRPGTYALATLAGLVVGSEVVAFTSMRNDISTLLWLLPIAPLGVLVDYVSMRWKEKRTAAEMKRIFTEPPRWWPFWWPSRWRRADDVWARLPRMLKATRLALTLGVLSFAGTMQFVLLGLAIPGRSVWTGRLIGTGLALLPVALVGLVSSVVGVWRIAKKSGLSMEQANQVASAPTGYARYWKVPWAAQFLRPKAGTPALIEPATPQALAVAVGALVRQLPELQRDHVGNAGEAARALAAAIDALDGEIAVLARDADPSELARLNERLAALGPQTPGDSPAQREMRQLYASQLQLLERLARQREELSARRARYAELLRTLWLQMSALRADNAADAMRADDVSGRIRHIVRSVEHEVRASAEVDRLTATT